MYRLIVESLLGLRLETDKLYFDPCLPSDWITFKIHYRFRETMYMIVVTQLYEVDTKLTIILDGTESKDKYIHLVDDRREHSAQVKLQLYTKRNEM